ncbi:hypothetical protein niasHT_039180 [Heterodera trifolii]|uniref:Uncharacterized protein n=1 Tax=Heterodera trifolii TaxID=157864 RepID=A0ABD2IC35_9BILA
MAILLNCVLLLSIMAIFCDCMKPPGEKGKSPNKGKSSSSAANSPTVTEGTPKHGGKPKGKDAARSPAEKARTPKRGGSDPIPIPKKEASNANDYYGTPKEKSVVNSPSRTAGRAAGIPKRYALGTPEFYETSPRKTKGHNAIDSPSRPNKDSPKRSDATKIAKKSAIRNARDQKQSFQRKDSTTSADYTAEDVTETDYIATETEEEGNDQPKALKE